MQSYKVRSATESLTMSLNLQSCKVRSATESLPMSLLQPAILQGPERYREFDHVFKLASPLHHEYLLFDQCDNQDDHFVNYDYGHSAYG